MRSLARVALMALSAGAVACAGPVYERPWIEVKTPNFQLISSMSAEETGALALELERFRAVVATVTNANLGESPVPTKIFVFENGFDFRRFGGGRGTAGWFAPRMRDNVVALAESGQVDPASIVLHEYVHFLLRNESSLHYPTWYDEGFAEYMRTVTVHEGELLVIGAVPRDRMGALASVRWMSLARVVEARGYGAFRGYELDLFYAQAWALVHYLHQGREGRHSVARELTRYLDLVEAGSSDAEAFESAFGASLNDTNRALKRYLTGGEMSVVALPLSELEHEAPRPSLRALPPGEAASRLGRLALVSGEAGLAQSLFTTAIAANPADARAEAGLARALALRGRPQEAAARFGRALDRAPDDALNRLDLGVFLQSRAEESRTEEERQKLLQEARRHYAKSQKLDPTVPETYAMYGSTFLLPGEDAARGIKTIEHAHRMLPSNGQILHLLAKGYVATGRRDEAREIVERLVAWSHSGDRDEKVDEMLDDLAYEARPEEASPQRRR